MHAHAELRWRVEAHVLVGDRFHMLRDVEEQLEIQVQGLLQISPQHALEEDDRQSNALVINQLDLGVLYAESGQTSQGSFSAVSKPTFASKYSLESSRLEPHNALLRTVLQSQLV